MTRQDAGNGRSGRIVMLVPHEPARDPRVVWVGDLCRSLGPVHTVCLADGSGRPRREFDGPHRIDRVPAYDDAGWAPRLAVKVVNRLHGNLRVGAYVKRRDVELDADFVPLGETTRRQPFHRTPLDAQRDRLRFFNQGVQSWVLADALRRAVRGIDEPPALVVCHDVYTLPAALLLKRRFGCPVVYDSHEYWPEADLLVEPWGAFYWRRAEGPLVRRVDAVVTVSPPLADRLRKAYCPRSVVCVPNWTPFETCDKPARAAGGPVKFLLQGGAAPGRGQEMLLDTWRRMNEPRAELYVRCPESAYLADLRARHADPARGVYFLPAVAEADLVQAAAFADVGVIPYPRNSANHLVCCPNKLSQYLQAGLPVLGADTLFVGDRLRAWKCGWTYDGASGGSLAAVVRSICRDEVGLQRAREAALKAGRDHCNWEAVAGTYADLLAGLLGTPRSAPALVKRPRAA